MALTLSNARTSLAPSAQADLQDPERAQFMQDLAVQGPSEVEKGWRSSGLSGRVNELYTQALKAGIDGRHDERAVLESQAQDLDQQAAISAPRVQNVTDVRSLRDAADWVGGALGGVRTSVAPAVGGLVGAGVGAVAAPFTGGVVNPVNAGFAGASAMGYDAETDEAVAAAMRDPYIRANHTYDEILAASRVKGGLNSLLEAAVPTVMGGKVAGTLGKGAVGRFFGKAATGAELEAERLAQRTAQQAIVSGGRAGAAKAVGKGVAEGATGEFVTEDAQSLVGQGAQNYLQDQPLDNLDYTQAFNEGMAGAVAGGGMGTIGGAGDVGHAYLGAGKEKVGTVRKDPVGAAADFVADAGSTVGKAAAKGLDWLERRASPESRAFNTLVEDPSASPEQHQAAATQWAQHVLESRDSTESERKDAQDFVMRLSNGDKNAAATYRDKLTVNHYENRHVARDTEVAAAFDGKSKASKMRASVVPFDDNDPSSYVADKEGRVTEEGFEPVDLTGKVSGSNSNLSPTSEWRAPGSDTRARELVQQVESSQIGQPVLPKQNLSVKGANRQQLETVADIWRKQGVSEKLLTATRDKTEGAQRQMAISMLGWMSRGFKVDGEVVVPEVFTNHYKDKSPAIIQSAAKLAFQQGIIGHDEAKQVPEIMKQATLQYAEATAVHDTIRSALPELIRDTYSTSDIEQLDSILRHVAKHGTTKAQEAALLKEFGSKENIAKAMSKLKEPKSDLGGLTVEQRNSGEDLTREDADGNIVDSDGNAVYNAEKGGTKYESMLTEHDAPKFSGVDKDNNPYNRSNAEHETKLKALGKRAKVVGVWDRVKSEYSSDEDYADLHDAELSLFEQYGSEFLYPTQLKALDEYGGDVADLIDNMHPTAREAILGKINRRYVMVKDGTVNEVKAADSLSKDDVVKFKEDWNVIGEEALVGKGSLFLEREGLKSGFPTSAIRLAKHAWSNVDGSLVVKGLGAHGAWQDVLSTVAAIVEADSRFSGRIGYKTEVGGANKIQWITTQTSSRGVITAKNMPAALKLPIGTLADAKAQALEAFKQGDKPTDINLATTSRAMYSALREYQGRESTSTKFAEYISGVLSPTYVDRASETQTKSKKAHEKEVVELYRSMRTEQGEWGDNYDGKGEAPKGSNVDRELAQRELKKTDEWLYNRVLQRMSKFNGEKGRRTGNTFRDLTANIEETRSKDDSVTPTDHLTDEAVQGTSRAEDPQVKNRDPAILRDNNTGVIVGGAPEASVEGSGRGGRPTDVLDGKGAVKLPAEDRPAVETARKKVRKLGDQLDARDWIADLLRKGIPAFNTAVVKYAKDADVMERVKAGLRVLTQMAPRGLIDVYDGNLTVAQAEVIISRAKKAMGVDNVRSDVTGVEADVRGRSDEVGGQGASEAGATRDQRGGAAEAELAADQLDDAIYKEDYAKLDTVEKLQKFAKHVYQRYVELERRDADGDTLTEREEGVSALAEQLVFDAKKYVKNPNGYGGMDFDSFFDGLEHTDADVETFVKSMAGVKQGAKEAQKVGGVVLPSTSPFTAKDQVKSDKATKFIGRGSAKSSTAAYAKAWGNRANTGVYTPTDVVFVSVEGNRTGRVTFDKVELQKAIDAGATIITDDKSNRERSYNVGEREVAEYLSENGYGERKGEWQFNDLVDSNLGKSKASTQTANLGNGKQATKPEQDAAKKHILDTIGDTIKGAFVKHFGDNSSGSWTPGNVQNVIRLALNSDVLSTSYHESMHEFFDMLKKHGNEATTKLLERVATNEVLNRKIERLLADHPAAAAQVRSSPEEAAAFMYQFWQTGQLKLGEEVGGFFNRIKRFINTLRGKVSKEVRDEREAEAVLRAFSGGAFKSTNGDTAVRDASMAELRKNTEAHNKALENLDKAGRDFVRIAGKPFFSAAAMMQGTKNEDMVAILADFNQEAGTAKGEKQALFDAIKQQDGIWMNRLNNILTAYSKEDLELARMALSTGTPAKDRVAKEIVEKINTLNDELFNYISSRKVSRWDDEAGKWLPVDKRKNYFTRVWDTGELQNRAVEFRDRLLKVHMKELEATAAIANTEMQNYIKGTGDYANLGPAAQAEVEKSLAAFNASGKVMGKLAPQTITAEMVADAILHRLLGTKGHIDLAETESSIGMSPVATSINRRTLSWIDDKQFEDFKSKDIANILTSYVSSMVKRAEYTNTFGNGSEKLKTKADRAVLREMGGKELVEKAERLLPLAIKQWGKAKEAARKAGAEFNEPFPTLRAVGQKVHNTAVGDEKGHADLTKALKTLDQGFKAIMAMEGTLGANISHGTRQINNVLMTYQTVRLLPLVMFSSINDVMGIVANGGELSDAWGALVSGMKEIKLRWGDKKSTDGAAQRAEIWGTVDAGNFMDTLGQTYGSMWMSDKARRFSDSFFKWNGMEGWNRAMRIKATTVAERVIKSMQKEGIDTKDAAQVARLEALFGKGFKTGDIKLDANGDLDTSDVNNQAAVMRWVSNAIMSPNAAHRTIWGSDPHMASFWMLKQFAYTFHRVMLKGALEQAKLGNYRPVMTLMLGYAPVTIAADAVKELLVPGDEPPWMQGGLDDFLRHGVDRAGVMGVPGLGYDALTSFNGPVVGSLSALGGPTVGQMLSVPFDTAGKTALGAAPFGSLLRRAAD